MRDYVTISKRLRQYSENCVAYKLDADFANAVTDAADAIEELLTEKAKIENSGKLLAAAFERLKEKVPHWISVEERLPEDGKYVLCWYEYYHWNKEKMLPEYGIGYCINGHWGGEVSNGRDCKVLYWMPLPTPPKGVE